MLRPKYLLFSVALLGALALALSSCGGGGGGGGGQSGPPFIGAELNSFPPGAAPPGFTSNAFVEVLDSNDSSITNASVTMNGVPLAYNANDQGYEGNVLVAPGGSVSLSVTVGGNTYAASATQFTSYPTISAPAAGAFDQTVSNMVTWSGGAPVANATKYVLGVLDAGNPNNPLVWPQDQFLNEIPLSTTSVAIPAASINGGDRLVIAGISVHTAIPNAISGSVLSVAGFNYVPINVNGMRVTRHALADGLFPDKVVWSGTQFVAAGGFGTILTSPDGSTWTTRRSGTQEFLRGIAWSGTQFVAVGSQGPPGGELILTSTDGISWTPRTAGLLNGLNGLLSVTWGNGQFVAGTFDTLITSPDGVTWAKHNAAGAGAVTGIAWSGTKFVAVGNGSGGIQTSPDGAVWTPQTGSNLVAVTSSGTQFVAVGYNGLVQTSPDGVTWTTRSSGTAGILGDVIWTGSQFVAVGTTSVSFVRGNVTNNVFLGAIITSPDGVTWTPQAAGPSRNGLGGVAWSGTTLVMVGEDILTSP